MSALLHCIVLVSGHTATATVQLDACDTFLVHDVATLDHPNHVMGLVLAGAQLKQGHVIRASVSWVLELTGKALAHRRQLHVTHPLIPELRSPLSTVHTKLAPRALEECHQHVKAAENTTHRVFCSTSLHESLQRSTHPQQTMTSHSELN